MIPQKLYYGVGRPILVNVNTPQDGEAEIRLYRPGQPARTPHASATIPGRGEHDLAQLFPELWESSDPALFYAQPFQGGLQFGSPLVIQPLVSPPRARSAGQQISWQAAPPQVSGVRVYVERHAIIETSMGEITLRMRPDEAPNTVYSFLHLAENGFYDDVIFHRIIPDFVVQGGDPTGTGSGGPGYNIDLERSQLPHDFGVVSMARSSDPDSNGSQIFICLTRERTSILDGRYTGFAEAVEGADVIRELGAVSTGAGDRPVDPPVIRRVRIEPAPPYDSAGLKPVSQQ